MINVFAREITPELTSLVKQLDKIVGNPKDNTNQSRAFLVLLTDDADSASAALAKAAEEHEIRNVPLTTFDRISGPPNYKVAEKADVTVLMWTKQKVDVNFAFGKGELNAEAVKQVVDAAKKHAG